MQKPASTLLLLALGLFSCSPVGPDYEKPAIDLSDRFVDGDTASKGRAGAQAWWLEFNDAMLNDLISLGIDQNLDVQAAIERIEETRAVVRTTGRAAQLSGDGYLSYLRGDQGFGAETTGSATLNANYVFDIFGGIQRGREQAEAQNESAVS